MTNLTDNEFKVLRSLDNSEYGEVLRDDVWTFTIADNSDLSGKIISGTVSSLVKKGFVKVGGWGEEATIRMTEEGTKAYIAYCVANSLKARKPSGY